jgi:uroporphyrin-III C-methyltransferase/precorrin-2 dehydrogenase/sirohydrochlorin ferrochelatase/uroporphyrin-III C-methyltransferase
MCDKPIVYLVGAGSGDPELLTLKSLRLIQEADVVVYDRLVTPAILSLIPATTQRIYVGKQRGRHSLEQGKINTLLVDLTQQHRKVVRLKGGDPYIFGRGSEEAQCLVRHGINFEVVPGITAASACSAYSGIPLTHRGMARSVEFITGHFRDAQTVAFDWRRFSDPQLTLVFYMGLSNLPLICEQLVAAGRAADTPAAVIENGSTPQQRRLVSDLQRLPAASLRQGFDSPSLIIVGEVVTLADELDWFGQRLANEKEHDYASVG